MAIIAQLYGTRGPVRASLDYERHSIIPPGSKDPGNRGFTCHEVEFKRNSLVPRVGEVVVIDVGLKK